MVEGWEGTRAAVTVKVTYGRQGLFPRRATAGVHAKLRALIKSDNVARAGV